MLGVSPNSSREEIQLAYVLRKREIAASGEHSEAEVKAAYETLLNPGRRGAEGSRTQVRPAPGGRRGRTSERTSVNTVALLGLLLCVLVGVLAFHIWPTYGYRFRTFEANDQLLDARTKKPYGVVLEARTDHIFSNGKVGPAYRLRLESDGSEVWYPASDVQYVCVRQ